ncbi:MAG: RecX family transcriptional regulator [Chitinophagales bacterium]|nr:RecX family transcriptional regulator [Chitinophagales bacterium]
MPKKVFKKFIYTDDEQDLLERIEHYCAYTERCEQDVILKLKSWEVPSTLFPKVIDHLKNNRFLEQGRYGKMFVRGKFNLKGWGKQKIKFQLNSKHIDEDTIETSLREINEEDYIDKLHLLLSNKQKSVSAKDNFELKNKLTKYALQKGYEYHYIKDWLEKHFQE